MMVLAFYLQNARMNENKMLLEVGSKCCYFLQESNDLQAFASGELIPWEVYKMICRDLRVDTHRGAGKDELIQLYERLGLRTMMKQP